MNANPARQIVAILTLAEDLHGHAVADAIRNRGNGYHLIATDRLPLSPNLSWRLGDSPVADLTTVTGESLDLRRVDAFWLRRVRTQAESVRHLNEEARTLIPTEIQAALYGVVFTQNQAQLYNSPIAELTADNKLVQLATAKASGFRVPPTLVSSNAAEVRRFSNENDGNLIVKSVRGTGAFSIPTRRVRASDLDDGAGIAACPAIWQVCVPGNVHLRIHVFGPRVLTAKILARELDWRPNLSVPITPFELDPAIGERCVSLVRELGLAMGIIDAKLGADGDLCFLEINPQGQFLFIEALTGLALTDAAAELLVGSTEQMARHESSLSLALSRYPEYSQKTRET